MESVSLPSVLSQIKTRLNHPLERSEHKVSLFSCHRYATARLEDLSLKKRLNKFALKAKRYIKATPMAFEQLKISKSETA